MYYQQGDVIVEKVDSIPSSAVEKEVVSKIVLAQGSATGHAHVINDTTNVKVFSEGDDMYLSVSKETVLSHEEHNSITVEPGNYQIRKVKEFDHFAEEVREVQD